ncbi:MAG: cation:proton antiporter, partial [Planctomycetes bacterium]|nr:cation:proton antiporter [Planctomycetota bacterium]
YTRQHFSTAVSPFSRVQAKAVWDLFVFLLNALIFLILGLQFTSLLEQVPPEMLGSVVLSAAAVSAAVLVVRWIWVPVATLLPRVLSAEMRRKDPLPHWKPIFLVSWTAMRGIVTLASALALPRTLSDGTPFPYRTEVILIAMGVILSTLLLQGFSLGPIIKAFRFEPEHKHHEEARLARRESLRRAMEALEDMEHEAWADPVEVARLRGELTDKLQRHQRQAGGSDAGHRLRLGVMEAERRMLLRLRNEGAISDEVMREIETELDYEAMRLGAGDQRTTSR